MRYPPLLTITVQVQPFLSVLQNYSLSVIESSINNWLTVSQRETLHLVPFLKLRSASLSWCHGHWGLCWHGTRCPSILSLGQRLMTSSLQSPRWRSRMPASRSRWWHQDRESRKWERVDVLFFISSSFMLPLTWLEPLVWCHLPLRTPSPRQQMPTRMAKGVPPKPRRRRPVTQQWALPCHLTGRTWEGISNSKVTASLSILVFLSTVSDWYYGILTPLTINVWSPTRRPSMLRPLRPAVADSLLGPLGSSGCRCQWPDFWGNSQTINSQNISLHIQSHSTFDVDLLTEQNRTQDTAWKNKLRRFKRLLVKERRD